MAYSKKTAPLFQKWLFYGLATIFSGVMLGVMAEIAMDLVGTITSAATATNYVSTLFTGRSAEGIMQTVTQQLGLGVILSALLITVPPMAGMWFNGVMASSYYGSNYISGWNGMSGSVVGSGSGSGAYQQQVEQRVTEARQNLQANNPTTTQGANANNTNIPVYMPTAPSAPKNTSTDVMRTDSQMGHAVQPVSSNIKSAGNTDKTKADKGEKA